MKLKIIKSKVVKWEHGNNLSISMIKMLDDNGKFVKFIKLSDFLVEHIWLFDLVLPRETLEFYNYLEEELKV